MAKEITLTIGTRWWFGYAAYVAYVVYWALPERYSEEFSSWSSETIAKHGIWIS